MPRAFTELDFDTDRWQWIYMCYMAYTVKYGKKKRGMLRGGVVSK